MVFRRGAGSGRSVASGKPSSPKGEGTLKAVAARLQGAGPSLIWRKAQFHQGGEEGRLSGLRGAVPRSAVEKPPAGDGWLHEIKFDGYRLMAAIDGKSIRLLTRSGLDWTDRFPGIAEAFADFPAKSALVDGEAVIEDENGVSSFSALQEALSDRKTASAAVFFAFDLLYVDGYSLRELALADRKDALAKLLKLEPASPPCAIPITSLEAGSPCTSMPAALASRALSASAATRPIGRDARANGRKANA